MAITKIQQPSTSSAVPVGSRIWVVLDSTDNTQDGFKYIVDIYDSGSLRTTLKSSPDPDFEYGVFDVSRVLDDLMSYTFNPDSAALVNADTSDSYKQIDFEYGQEYQLAGSTFTEKGLASASIDLINIYQPRWKDLNFDITTYDQKFLTEAPLTQSIGSNETAQLHYLDQGALGTGLFKVRWYDENDSQVGSAENYSFATASGDYQVIRCGTKDLTQPSSSEYYTVQVYNATTPISEIRRFDIGYCSPQVANKVRVLFVSELGSVDGYTFTAINREIKQVSRESYESKPRRLTSNGIVERSYDKGLTDYRTETTTTWQLSSGWLTESKLDWLVQMLESPYIWIETDTYGIVRAKVRTEEFEKRKNANSELVLMTVELELSIKDSRR